MAAPPRQRSILATRFVTATAGAMLLFRVGVVRGDDDYFLCKLDYIAGYEKEHRRAKTVLPKTVSRNNARFSMFVTNTNGATHASTNFRDANGQSTTKILKKGQTGLDALYRMCIGLRPGQSDKVRAKYFAQHQNDIHYILDESTFLGPNKFSLSLDGARNISAALTGETRTRSFAGIQIAAEKGEMLVNCHERLFVRCAADGTGAMVSALEKCPFALADLTVMSLSQAAEVRKALDASGLTVIPMPTSDADFESILAGRQGKTLVLLAHLVCDAWSAGSDEPPSYSIPAKTLAEIAHKHKVNLVPLELFPTPVDLPVGPAFINPFTKLPPSRPADVPPQLPTPAESITALKDAAAQATNLAEFLGLLPAGDLFFVADAFSDGKDTGIHSYSLCHRSKKHEYVGGIPRMVTASTYPMALSIRPPARPFSKGKMMGAAALLLFCVLIGAVLYKFIQGLRTAT